jgi:hypothetical protein
MPKLIEFSDDELRSLQSLMIKLGFDTVKTISSNPQNFLGEIKLDLIGKNTEQTKVVKVTINLIYYGIIYA